MTTTAPAAGPKPVKRRPPRAARRFGYLLAGAINAAILAVLHLGPGWQRFGFLSERFADVLGVMTLSLVVGLLVDLLYVRYDPVWLKRLGDAVTALLACIVLARMWTVFPFDLAPDWQGWDTPLRAVLGFLTVGAGIGVVASLAELVALLARGEAASPADR
jgi:hypothetical protein